MSSDDPTDLVRAIHASSLRFVIAVTGGGAGAIAHLLEVPGGSRTLLEAIVPYSSTALDDYLTAKPESYCSPATARSMALSALLRARRLDAAAIEPAGFGCTASLASDRPKRGEHRVHLAAQTLSKTVVWSVKLAKDHRTRLQEERLVAEQLLNLIAELSGVTQRITLVLVAGEDVEVQSFTAPLDWQELFIGRRTVTKVNSADQTGPRVVLPGAFNPVHQGHRRMAQIAAERLGGPCWFELSIVNVDKPPLDYLEMDRRTKQFSADEPVLLTRAPTFVEKARALPGVTFTVGADTIDRIADARYYDSKTAMDDAIDEIAALGCRFLVFGRNRNGVFRTLNDLELPEALRERCDQVPQDEFEESISSTELRRRKKDKV